MADRLTIYELTKYYTNRYGLPLSPAGGTPYNQNDGMARYYRKLVLILQDTKIGQLICNDLCQEANCLDRITTDHFRVLGRHLEGALTSVFGI